MLKSLCAAVGVNALESSNTVGYQETDWSGKQMCCVSLGFVAVGSRDTTVVGEEDYGTFQLKDIKATGFDPYGDLLQTLEPEEADMDEGFIYIDEVNAGGNAALVGWWDYMMTAKADDAEFSIAQGFLGNFGSLSVSLNGSGEVITDGATYLDYTSNQMVMVPNLLPRTVLLGEIVAEGFDPYGDLLQTLEPEEADMDEGFIYIDEINAGGNTALIGWWDYMMTAKADEVEFPAGSAMLGNFGSLSVALTFPKAN